MSKPNGISRVKRKRKTESNNSDLKSKQFKSTSRESANVFEDFDLTDLTFNQKFNPIKSVNKSFSHSMARNVSKATRLTIDPNSSKQLKSDSNSKNVFGDFDLTDLKCNQSSNSFRNVSKVFNELVDRNDVTNSSDLKSEQLKSDSNPKNVFGDFDLSDVTFNETYDSIKSVSKAFSHLMSTTGVSKAVDNSTLLTIDPNSNKQLKSESNAKNVFEDFDLSDLKCNQTSDSLRSLGKAFTHLIDKNDVSKTTDYSSILTIDSNSSKQIKSESKNVFKDFDLSDLKCNENLESFRSVSKAFNQLKDKTNVSKTTDYSSLLTIDSNSNKSFSIPETTRKEIISNIFESVLDLSDFKYNESFPSFRNSRTAYQPLKSTNINTEDNIDWNDIFNEPFGESQDFRTSSPKPKFSSQRIKSSSPKPESKKSQEMNFSFEIDDKFFDSYIDKTEHTTALTQNMTQDLKSIKLEPEVNEDCINSVKDISFSLRSDFETHNESTSQQFFSELTEQDIKEVKNSKSELPFMGFCSGTGKQLQLNEEQLSNAKLLFADIEKWLIKEIIDNKSQFRDCDPKINTYSQKFMSNVENRAHKSVLNLNNLMENESIDTFAEIMSSTFENS